MNKAMMIAACAAMLATFSFAGASAQTVGSQTVKTDSMNSNASMMRHHHMMRHHGMKSQSKRGGQPKSGSGGGH